MTIGSPTAAVSAQPIRTCLGCRQAVAQTDLLRIAVVDGVLTADPARRLGGRGAYVHPRVACLEAAQKRRAFTRALRLTTPPSGLEEIRQSMSTTHHAGA